MSFDFETEAAKRPPQLKDKQPASSPDVLVINAERAFSVANRRREEVAGIFGFDINYLDSLPAICAKLIEYHRANTRLQDSKSELSFAPAREEANALIATVARAGRYVLRHNEEVQRDLARIGDVGAMHDRVGDLRRVAFLCEEHPELITADKRIPANVVERARELAAKLATIADDSAFRAALQQRNLAYWMLHEALGEVRAAVRFGFPHDPKFVDQVCTPYEPPKKRSDEPEPQPEPEPSKK